MRRTSTFSFLCAVAMIVGVPVHADPVAGFYAGKTIRFYVGAGAGGGYDLYARTLGQFMAARIPGRPQIVVSNMPGSGGVKASNYVYSVAPRDGSAILMPFWTHPIFQLIRPKGIKFDMSKMSWIGNMAELNSAIAVMAGVAETIDDAKKKEIVLAASGKGSETYIYPQFLNSLIGTRFKIVTGYSGTRTMTVAMERGEAQGRGGSYQSWKAIRPKWHPAGKIVFLAQAGLRRLPVLKDTPLIQELVKPEDRRLARVLSAPAAMGRIVGFPPLVGRDKLTALRKAFVETMKDPAFIAEAEKRKMDLDLATGEQVEAYVKELMETPPEVLKRAANVLKY